MLLLPSELLTKVEENGDYLVPVWYFGILVDPVWPAHFAELMRLRGERRVSFRVVGGIFLVGTIGWLSFFAYSTIRKRVTFPDGSTLELAGVTLGTNIFVEGNSVEKILGDRISPKGFSFGGLHFNRPQRFSSVGDASLTVWLQLKSTRANWDDFEYLWEGSKVIAANRGGRRLENFSVEPVNFSSNEVLIAVPLYSFPRDMRTLQLQIIPHGNYGKKVEFQFHNPLRVKSGKWKPAKIPTTNEATGLAIALLKGSADPPEVELKVLADGWHLASCRLFDDEGNGGYSWSKMEALGSGRFRMRFPHALERERIWGVNTKWVRAAGFPMSESSIFPDDPRVELQLTSGRSSAKLTNQIGEVFVCRLDGREISIEQVRGRERPYWALLAVGDEAGKAVSFYGGTATESGAGRSKFQSWLVGTTGWTKLTLKLVCAKTVNIEMHWMPKEF